MLQPVSLTIFPGTCGVKEGEGLCFPPILKPQHWGLRRGRRSRVTLQKPERGGLTKYHWDRKVAGNLSRPAQGQRAVETQKSAFWTQFTTAFQLQSPVAPVIPRTPAIKENTHALRLLRVTSGFGSHLIHCSSRSVFQRPPEMASGRGADGQVVWQKPQFLSFLYPGLFGAS